MLSSFSPWLHLWMDGEKWKLSSLWQGNFFPYVYFFIIHAHTWTLYPLPQGKKLRTHTHKYTPIFIHIHIFVYTHMNNLCIYAHVCVWVLIYIEQGIHNQYNAKKTFSEGLFPHWPQMSLVLDKCCFFVVYAYSFLHFWTWFFNKWSKIITPNLNQIECYL